MRLINVTCACVDAPPTVAKYLAQAGYDASTIKRVEQGGCVEVLGPYCSLSQPTLHIGEFVEQRVYFEDVLIEILLDKQNAKYCLLRRQLNLPTVFAPVLNLFGDDVELNPSRAARIMRKLRSDCFNNLMGTCESAARELRNMKTKKVSAKIW